MPGIIQVSVLEAVDLPEAFTDQTVGKDLIAKVVLGRKLYKTQPGIADQGKIDSWKTTFSFPVMNLRDKLVVAICNNEDHSITQTTIEISSIIEKGSRDEFVELEGGGRIHLRTSFVLTDEERKKIETMRLSTSRRREEERLKKTVVFQSVSPTSDDELRKSPISTVTITDVDVSSTDERTPKESLIGPLEFGSTTMPRAPIVMFDYARAVGSQSGRNLQRKDWRSNTLSNDGKSKNMSMGLEVQNVGGSARNSSELVSSERSRVDISAVSPTREMAPSSMKRLGQGDFTKSTIEQQKVAWSAGNLTGRNVLHFGVAAMATSRSEKCIYVEGQLDKRILNGCSTQLAYSEQMQQWNRHQRLPPVDVKVESPRIEGQSGQGQRFDVRSGSVARWSHKTGPESRWASPRKARRIIREDRIGRVSDHLKARTKIIELIKAAGCSHASFDDYRSFRGHHSLADGFGTVLNKVVGGAAMLLAALFIIWPRVEGSPYGCEEIMD